MADPRRLLVFGASGAIGSAVTDHAIRDGWQVVGASRSAAPVSTGGGIEWLHYDPLDDGGRDGGRPPAFAGQRPFDGICFAQGANVNDSLHSFDITTHLALYRANCLSVVVACAMLVRERLLSAEGARIVIVSSIWQERARADKMSYAMTKAAIGGLVRAASVDLGSDGHLVNGVLPGVLDTPMTRSQLSPEQIALVSGKTTAGRLPDLATLADTILFLCSARNQSISGQSLTVDLGMSNANLL